MKIIQLTKGKETTVDDEDYVYLSKVKWHTSSMGYACNRNKISIFMHRLITNAPENKEVDHINGDRLDNRKENLRLVTHQENMFNVHKARGYQKVGNRYKSYISVKNQRIYLGCFVSKEEASNAYLDAKREYHIIG